MLPGSKGYAPNPPACATSITGLLASLSECAKRITWATDFCMDGWSTAFAVGIDYNAPPQQLFDYPQDCAIDVSASLKGFIKAAKFASKAAFVCGDVDSGCAQQVFSALTSVAAIAQYVSEAVYFCQLSRWWCAGSSADIAVSIMFLIQNIHTGLELCSGAKFVPPAPPGFTDASNAPEPEPGAPEPVPDGAAPEPQPDASQPTVAPNGDTLQSSFFPGMELTSPMGINERRLKEAFAANVTDGLDPKVVEEANRQRQELTGAMERFRLLLTQALRKAEFEHALRRQPLPETLRHLEGRLDNATAQAKAAANGSSPSAERMEEQMTEFLAKIKDFELLTQSSAQSPLVV